MLSAYAPNAVAALAILQGLTILPVIHAASLPSPFRRNTANATEACHYIPGDTQWPTSSEWLKLNSSIGGRLIAGVPLAQPCFEGGEDPSVCAALRDEWTTPELYYEDPVHVMSPYFLNNSCTPFAAVTANTNSSCTLGNMPSYAISVQNAEDVVAGLKFVQDKNIRLVIKNTGHDYLGRSNGKGSLSLWTHNLKDIDFLNYSSPYYTGPAVKIGAGVQAFEVYEKAVKKGLRFVGGLCPTVGVAGGYVAGGGHGLLMGKYGLAADNTLEFEVVTTDGQLLVASPEENVDLFWALNGGGGGTYAVVISQTTRLHPDGPVAGALLIVSNNNNATYWAAIKAWQEEHFALNNVPDLTTEWNMNRNSLTILVTLLDSDEAAVNRILKPFVSKLNQLNATYQSSTTQMPNFHDHFNAYLGNLPTRTNVVVGGQFVTPFTVKDNVDGLVGVFRDIFHSSSSVQFNINGIVGNVSHARVGNSPESNAVVPAWRDALYFLNMDADWDPESPIELLDVHHREMAQSQQMIKDLAPDSGSYINEAVYDNPAWKEDYYGANYKGLLQVKEKYDPHHVLYGSASVGSDYWQVQSDGRLCRAQ